MPSWDDTSFPSSQRKIVLRGEHMCARRLVMRCGLGWDFPTILLQWSSTCVAILTYKVRPDAEDGGEGGKHMRDKHGWTARRIAIENIRDWKDTIPALSRLQYVLPPSPSHIMRDGVVHIYCLVVIFLYVYFALTNSVFTVSGVNCPCTHCIYIFLRVSKICMHSDMDSFIC